MDFLKWMIMDILSDAITWVTLIVVGVCLTGLTIDYIREKRGAVK